MLVSTVITGQGLSRSLAAMAGVDVATPVYLAGALYRTKVRAGASGRPGPRVQTGDYRRGISQQNRRLSASRAEAHVFSNSPQALRLEYGFKGRDALGRYYDQPAYPHWRPALDGISDFMREETARAVAERTRQFTATRLGQIVIGGSK